MEPIHIREEILGLLKGYESAGDFSHIPGPRVHVNHIIGKLSLIYEKIRNSVDAKEEKLLHKYAILRILRRRVFIQKDKEQIAESLVKELIRAGYLPNDTIPESIIGDIHKVLEKYYLLLSFLSAKKEDIQVDALLKQLLDLSACEIEEILKPGIRERSLTNATFALLKQNLQYKLRDDHTTDTYKSVHLFLSCYRALVTSDSAMLFYELLKLYFPNWNHADEETIKKVSESYFDFANMMKKYHHNKFIERLYRITKRFSIPILVIRDVVLSTSGSKNAIDLIQDWKNFEVACRNAYVMRYTRAKQKLRKLAVRSIIFMFVTKVVIAIALELPYDIFVVGHIDYIALGINISFPPLLLFLMTTCMRGPKPENLDTIILGVKELVDKNQLVSTMAFEMADKKKKGKFSIFLIQSMYVIVFLSVFFMLVHFLILIHFNLASILMFLFFLCVVSFLGVRIRRTLQDLVFVRRKENSFTVVLDFFAVPIVKSGRLLTFGLSTINVFVILLDWIIEMPFKLIVDIIEETSNYLKEKRDEGEY